MRAMTITGFCLFADISDTTWENYCKEKDFIAVTKWIKDVIYSQKFEGAAAGLLNSNIIARDLGLKEKTETEHTIKTDFSEYSTEELIDRAKAVSKLGDE